MHNDARHFAEMNRQTMQTAVFATRVVHANMAPRYKQGHFVLFEKHTPAHVGDDIFVVLNDGTSIVWRLDGISDTELTVHSYAPEITETVPRRLIKEFHPVMWSVKGIERTDLGTVL
ncbi:S24 family peptidase [Paraburkholderia phytofirmans]|uniref:S24 family peptidase n=1 Tax=Paraburkholderia phytofirmans TaxID=261302 RepID=UPI0038BBC922